MKKYFIIFWICLFASACSPSVVSKHFKVIADPPDSVIRVVFGPDQKEQKYSSPAAVTVDVPAEPTRSGREILEVSKDRYKPVTIALRHINEGDTIRVKLEKKLAYQLKYRLLAPIPSDDLSFQDKTISMTLAVGEIAFQLGLKNLSEHPLKLLWERAEYTDIHARRFRLMHSGVRYQDRNNPVPDQVVLSGKALQDTITPIEHVFVSPKTGKYEVKALLGHEGAGVSGLKGKTVTLFIPIEINRAIIPYIFKIQIVEGEK